MSQGGCAGYILKTGSTAPACSERSPGVGVIVLVTHAVQWLSSTRHCGVAHRVFPHESRHRPRTSPLGSPTRIQTPLISPPLRWTIFNSWGLS